MLRELNIKNFAIIEDLQVEFTPGFNVLTGETGSGKSIIIDALELILGGRASKDFIRTGKERAFIQGLFTLSKDEENKIKEKYGIWSEEGLIVTRELFRNKPGIARLNGQIVTVSQLQELSGEIIDVFAQNEGRDLISPQKQRDLLDSFGSEKHKELLEETAEVYSEIRKTEDFLANQEMDDAARAREIDLLRFQMEEIESAGLTPEDESPLTEKYKKEKNQVKIRTGIGEALQALDGYEGYGALSGLDRGISALSSVTEYDDDLIPILESMEAIRYELTDGIRELQHLGEGESSEEELYRLEQRINLVNDMKRKYGNTLDDIDDFYQKASKRLEFLEEYENRIGEKKKDLRSLRERGEKIADLLTESRRYLGDRLEEMITRELRDLNIPDGVFYVKLEEKPLSRDGKEKVVFYIRTNQGQDPKPLAKIASGGEMSRIMLGFKSVIAKKDDMETLVFDEIDTGISGRTAQVVGKKIQELSADRQTLVISHLPQIVALADSHYYIEKDNRDGTVTSNIHRLRGEQRVIELARLISGNDITDMSMETAREMIESRNR